MVRKPEAAAVNEPKIDEAPLTAPVIEAAATPTPPAPKLEMALPSMMNSEAVKNFEALNAKLEGANMPGPAAAIDAPIAPVIASKRRFTRNKLHYAIAAAGLVAICSGTYLFSQGQQLWQKARAGAQLDADRIRTGSASTSAPVMVADAADLPREAAPARKIEMIEKAPPTANITLTDEVQKSAMAPIREEASPTQLTVRVTGTNVALRSGPATTYPAVAIGDPALRYRVLSWKGQWFRIGIPARDAIAGEKVAWIRNDFIDLNTSGEITE